MSVIGMNDRVDFQSRESAVPGLLTSVGHLNSLDHSYGTSHFHSSVLYGGKMYQSASQALEAYIDNFEKSSSTRRGTNKLHFRSISKPSPTSLDCKKEVFRERHFFRDLDFHSQPLRRRRASDPDLLSLTTDDLLEMPSDGSLPLTRSSVLQGSTQTQPRVGRHFAHNTFTKYAAKVSPGYSGAWQHKRDDSFELHCGRKVGYRPLNQTAGLKPSPFSQPGTVPQERSKYMAPSIPPILPVDDCRIGKHNLHSVSQHNYPRWLTSQKSELGVSGISSIPELKYPGWLLDCDLGSDSCEQETLNKREYLLPTGYENGLSDPRLYSGCAINTPKHKHFANYSGRNRRFYKHKGHSISGILRRVPTHADWFAQCNSEEVEDSHCSKPFRGEHLDLLIQKAERFHEVLSQHVSNPEQNQGSPGTEDILEAERSWDNPPVTFKSPVPVGNSEEEFFEASNPTLTDDSCQDPLNTGHQRNHSGSSGISGGKHHGPVEALKQMLFSLQTVQQSFDHEDAEESKEIGKISERMMSQTLGLDFEEASGNRSLQRALNHLKHLKELVDDIGAKMEKEAEGQQHE
ncbi:lung adenoma susceptibility protein 2 [Chiloscyllium punctatum]|uniref:lung adenoma susceptibility protein 2 n=1 Tax=Chiloscyllium punctatum TaxID=137246 RepID=UPI003B63411F